jgi:hypothetical protein
VAYLRFVRPKAVAGTRYREGFFCAAYELLNQMELSAASRERLEVLLGRFRRNLQIPDRFTSSRSKGTDRQIARGLSWFKNDASGAIEKSFELIDLLREHGYPIEVLRSQKVGRIVYEDGYQVVAEPFSDTLI